MEDAYADMRMKHELDIQH